MPRLALGSVPALALVSSYLRMQLQAELTQPHCEDHPLLRWYLAVDGHLIMHLHSEVELATLLLRDPLFFPGDA